MRHLPVRRQARQPYQAHPTSGLDRLSGWVQTASAVAGIAKGVYDVGKIVAPAVAAML